MDFESIKGCHVCKVRDKDVLGCFSVRKEALPEFIRSSMKTMKGVLSNTTMAHEVGWMIFLQV